MIALGEERESSMGSERTIEVVSRPEGGERGMGVNGLDGEGK